MTLKELRITMKLLEMENPLLVNFLKLRYTCMRIQTLKGAIGLISKQKCSPPNLSLFGTTSRSTYGVISLEPSSSSTWFSTSSFIYHRHRCSTEVLPKDGCKVSIWAVLSKKFVLLKSRWMKFSASLFKRSSLTMCQRPNSSGLGRIQLKQSKNRAYCITT